MKETCYQLWTVAVWTPGVGQMVHTMANHHIIVLTLTLYSFIFVVLTKLHFKNVQKKLQI